MRSEENGQTISFFFEVREDKIIRQVEQYRDCWIYSGDPQSFCPRKAIDGWDAYGHCSNVPFSELADLPLSAISLEEFAACRTP